MRYSTLAILAFGFICLPALFLLAVNPNAEADTGSNECEGDCRSSAVGSEPGGNS